MNFTLRAAICISLAGCTPGESASSRPRPGMWNVDSTESRAGGPPNITAIMAPTGVGAPNLSVICDSTASIVFGPLIPLIPEAEPGRATITYKMSGREPVTESWPREPGGMRVLAEDAASFLRSLRVVDTLLVQFPGTDIGTGAYWVHDLDSILGARCR
ncbi:MAG: hypothetical protein ACT4P7_04195 [Gemmatimonadaceae bacterium]